LLLKRIRQSQDLHTSADLALALSVWEPKAALEPLAQQRNRLANKDRWYGFVKVVERCCELGETKPALDDYVAFIRTATPDWLGDGGVPEYLFYLLLDHLDHPGMAQAAEHLFGDRKSPWLPLVQTDPKYNGVSRVPKLIPTVMLREPFF